MPWRNDLSYICFQKRWLIYRRHPNWLAVYVVYSIWGSSFVCKTCVHVLYNTAGGLALYLVCKRDFRLYIRETYTLNIIWKQKASIFRVCLLLFFFFFAVVGRFFCFFLLYTCPFFVVCGTCCRLLLRWHQTVRGVDRGRDAYAVRPCYIESGQHLAASYYTRHRGYRLILHFFFYVLFSGLPSQKIETTLI